MLLTMLHEKSEDRPDLIEMQYILKDIKRIDNCDHLLKAIVGHMQANTLQSPTSGRKALNVVQGVPPHKTLFVNVDHFVQAKLKAKEDYFVPVAVVSEERLEATDSTQSLFESIASHRGPQRFVPSQIRLTCPIHDNMPFKFFCSQSQNYLCNMCVLDR